MFTDIDLRPLAFSSVHWFADWPVADVPVTGSAVYTIWDRSGAYIYAGMSGRTDRAIGKGVQGRLHSHASGRRSGDQFCIYVCDRLVLPGLHNRLNEIADGSLSLDAETRTYIRTHLGFGVLPVRTPHQARAIEENARWGLFGSGPPLLNPLGERRGRK